MLKEHPNGRDKRLYEDRLSFPLVNQELPPCFRSAMSSRIFLLLIHNSSTNNQDY